MTRCPYCEGQMLEKSGVVTGLVTYYCVIAGKACRSTTAVKQVG